VQARFEELGGYALEGRAREVLAGLGFSQEMMDADVGALSGGWKMRVALARILLMRPDAMLRDEPSNHLDLESLIWLEQFLAGYDGALLMTSHDREFMNRIIDKVIEIDGGALTSYAGNYEFYEGQRALTRSSSRPSSSASRRCSPRRSTSSSASRPARPTRRRSRAGEEARQDRARRAAEAPAIRVVRVPAGAALGRRRGEPARRAQALRQPRDL
jgi:ATPase subunit of ABC transporter with duplicated ATPase domains